MIKPNEKGVATLQGTYANIYEALKSGATVMLASDVDANGEKLADYNATYNIGDRIIREHLERFVGTHFIKNIENGVAHYTMNNASPRILNRKTNEVMGNRYQEILRKEEENGNYNPNGKC